MENHQIQKEINLMIETEIAKIQAGNRNENYLARIAYLTIKKHEIEESLPRIGSSRDKDEILMQWCYISNEIKWLTTLLLQSKTIAIQNKVQEIEEIGKVDKKQFNLRDSEYRNLIMQRDVTRKTYYQYIADFDEMMRKRKELESMGIDMSEFKISGQDIAKQAKLLNEEKKMAFWQEYFKLAGEYIFVSDKKNEPSASSFGE